MSIYFTGPNGMYEPITRQEMYSDGTPRIKTEGWQRLVDRADTVVFQGSSMAEFMNMIILVRSLNYEKFYRRDYNCCPYIERLVIPYLPGARQDRINPDGDVLFTSSVVADMINECHFPSGVVSLDPHSPVMPRMIEHFREHPLENVVKQIPKRYDGIIAPDKGAKDRAKRVADSLNIPLYLGGKTRDVSNGKLTGFTLENLNYDNMRPNGHYLVVDDICDGGGTFIGLAEKIHQQYATADLYVSHGIFSKGTRHLNKAYGSIYTTDSLPLRDGNKVTVLPVVKDMI